jgi:glutamate racemase
MNSAISALPRIGVFDSGIGGLTVVKSLIQRLPLADYLYLGDIARLPYGTKSSETIRAYLVQCLEFLADKKVDALVVACNSASTQLQETHWKGIPIFNVIDPAAETAAQKSVSGKILVLATRATATSQVYETRIKAIRPLASVSAIACPLFVPLAEEGLWEDKLTNLIAFRYLGSLVSQRERLGLSEDPAIDTAILGCTHYPLLKSAIQKALGPQCSLIESGEPLAQKMIQDLGDYFNERSALLEDPSARVIHHSNPLKIYLTDQPDSLVSLIPRILGEISVQVFKAKL